MRSRLVGWSLQLCRKTCVFKLTTTGQSRERLASSDPRFGSALRTWLVNLCPMALSAQLIGSAALLVVIGLVHDVG
jgi:hypothetical protein